MVSLVYEWNILKRKQASINQSIKPDLILHGHSSWLVVFLVGCLVHVGYVDTHVSILVGSSIIWLDGLFDFFDEGVVNW